MTVLLLDDLKAIGFRHATLAGISIAISDMTVPEEKEEILKNSHGEVNKVEDQYRKGIITGRERYNKIIDVVNKIRPEILDAHPILKYRVNNLINGRNVRL